MKKTGPGPSLPGFYVIHQDGKLERIVSYARCPLWHRSHNYIAMVILDRDTSSEPTIFALDMRTKRLDEMAFVGFAGLSRPFLYGEALAIPRDMVWSPTGHFIVYWWGACGGTSGLVCTAMHRMRPDGDFETIDGFPDYSMLTDKNNRFRNFLFEYDEICKTQPFMTGEYERRGAGENGIGRISFNPRTDLLLALERFYVLPGLGCQNRDVVLADVLKGKLIPLGISGFNGKAFPLNPRWSPDGRMLSVEMLNPISGSRDICLLQIDDAFRTRKVDVVHFPSIKFIKQMVSLRPVVLDWSPDGKKILFAATCRRHCRKDLFEYHPLGSGILDVESFLHSPHKDASFKWLCKDSARVAQGCFSADGKQVAVLCHEDIVRPKDFSSMKPTLQIFDLPSGKRWKKWRQWAACPPDLTFVTFDW